MKELPIKFSTEMVQAILRGEKTQTRRIVKDEYNRVLLNLNTVYPNEISESGQKLKLKFNIGDQLYVRETWTENGLGYYRYRADFKPEKWAELTFKGESVPEKFKGKWKSSLFMPKEAARVWLEVTNVRVERLNNISDEDAYCEGIRRSFFAKRNYSLPESNEAFTYDYPRRGFRMLWEEINGKGSWELNPWVWVYEFKVIEK